MAYDEQLAADVRELLADEDDITERRMFGGLAFMKDDHIAVAVSGQGGLMARVGRDDAAELLERPGVEPMVMKGREMGGWLRVDAAELSDEAQLAEWVRRGLGVVEGL